VTREARQSKVGEAGAEGRETRQGEGRGAAGGGARRTVVDAAAAARGRRGEGAACRGVDRTGRARGAGGFHPMTVLSYKPPLPCGVSFDVRGRQCRALEPSSCAARQRFFFYFRSLLSHPCFMCVGVCVWMDETLMDLIPSILCG
jgi:hypothetical protein